MPRVRRLIYAAARPAFRRRLAAAKQALALQTLQRGINLAKLGGPEIVNALIEDGFQVVAAGWLAKQTKQDVFQAHAPHYIIVYIKGNCYYPAGASRHGLYCLSDVCRTIRVEWHRTDDRMVPSRELGKLLLVFGVILVGVGALLFLGARLQFRLGRLPGDIEYQGRHGSFYFPIVTCIVASVALTLILWIVNLFRR